MNNRIQLIILILILWGLSFGATFPGPGSRSKLGDQKHSLRCTKEALAALKSFPKLSYKCGEESDAEVKFSPRRRAALKAYTTRLESAASANWWAAAVDELNACGITHEARTLTDSEQSEIDSSTKISGDGPTRFLVVPDPCVKFSYITRNAFVLHRADSQVYATQVVDAFYAKIDPGVEMEMARQNGETLIIVQTTEDPMPTPEFGDSSIRGIGDKTYSVYAIDPATHRAVPRNLFMIGRKLINVLIVEAYLLDEEELEKQWHAPELVLNGGLSPRFQVYSLTDNRGMEAKPLRKFSVETYVWNGRYYALQRNRPGPAKRRQPRNRTSGAAA